MNLDTLLKQLREEDRAAEPALDSEFRREVLAEIRHREAAERQENAAGSWRALFGMWLTLLREPRWALSVLAVGMSVAVLTAWAGMAPGPQGQGRTALALDAFAPFPPHTPERLLVARFSYDE